MMANLNPKCWSEPSATALGPKPSSSQNMFRTEHILDTQIEYENICYSSWVAGRRWQRVRSIHIALHELGRPVQEVPGHHHRTLRYYA